MTDQIETSQAPELKPRKIGTAVVLSCLCAGLGQIYCGRMRLGLILLALYALTGAIGSMVFFPVAPSTAAILYGVLMANTFIWAFSMIHAALTAQRHPRMALHDYNRWYVYVLLMLLTAAPSISAAMMGREHLMEAFFVPTKALEPTVHKGERILVNKQVYRHDSLRRGDIVVFHDPSRFGGYRVARVTALPGDQVEIHDNQVSIRYALAASSMPATVPTAAWPVEISGEMETRAVPKGCCFVVSDILKTCVPLGNIVGRADYIYWPRFVKLAG